MKLLDNQTACHIIANHLSVDATEITATTNLRELGLASMDFVQLIIQFEDYCGETISYSSLQTINTVADLVDGVNYELSLCK